MANPSTIFAELIQCLKRFIPLLPHETRFRFHEVEVGKLYRSAYPNQAALAHFVKSYGIKSLVILLRNYENYIRDYASAQGITILQIPISGRAPTDNEVTRFLEFVSGSANQPALMHCAQGRDRTGCFCFVYRVERMGWSILDAWQEMKKLGHSSLPWHQLTQGFLKEWLEKKYGVQLK